MTIRFAAAMNGTMPAIAGVLCFGAPLDAANDNGSQFVARQRFSLLEMTAPVPMEADMAEAIMHFARYGLCAAEQAGKKAQDAHSRGDITARTMWLGICRQLDRRLAVALARRLAG